MCPPFFLLSAVRAVTHLKYCDLHRDFDVIDIDENEGYIQAENVVSCDYEGGKALLDLEKSTYFKLNNSATLIWNWLENPTSRDGLVSKMTDIFEVDPATCKADVSKILLDFVESKLVHPAQ